MSLSRYPCGRIIVFLSKEGRAVYPHMERCLTYIAIWKKASCISSMVLYIKKVYNSISMCKSNGRMYTKFLTAVILGE